MGISSLPTPSEGVLILVVVNTAFTISIFKEIAGSILRFLGFRTPETAADRRAELQGCGPNEPSATERFRSRFKPVRFGPLRAADCRVCLARFEPESEVDRLGCGHLFHRACIERWLDYHHVTCPLCRTHVIPADQDSPWF